MFWMIITKATNYDTTMSITKLIDYDTTVLSTDNNGFVCWIAEPQICKQFKLII